MTNLELRQKLDAMSEEERKTFFVDVNKDSESKATFLRQFIGEQVEVVYADDAMASQRTSTDS